MDVVLTGSVAFDYLMHFPGYFRNYLLPDKLDAISLSFLVDKMIIQRGGNAANIAYTLALFGYRPRLMATVGQDFEEYRAWLESKGVDTSATRMIPGVFTASFFANTDLSNAQIASFYPGAMAYAGQLSFYELVGGRPDLVVISPNDLGAMQRYVQECHDIGIPYFYDPSQQIIRLESAILRKGVEFAEALFLNDYEYELIKKITGMSLPDILTWVKFLVVTMGEQGAKIYSKQGNILIPVVPAARIADPTGVGDAFRGGFLVGYGHDWDLELCGQIGALAATYCLENTGPQGHCYTPGEFVDRFRQHFEDHGKLNKLLEKSKHSVRTNP